MHFTDYGVSLLTDNLCRISNQCSCETFNEDTQESTPSEYCFGDCWDDSLHLFEIDTQDLRDISDTWVVEGLPLWNRTIRGSFTIKNAADLLRGITVNSDWTLRYKVTPTHIWCYLSHHDAAGSFKAYPVIEDSE